LETIPFETEMAKANLPNKKYKTPTIKILKVEFNILEY
jgi:hypothetical protein